MKVYMVLMVVLLSACATAPKGAKAFSEVNIPRPSNGKSTLVFYRKITPPASYEMRVHINGKETVSLPNNTFSYVSLNAGTTKIETKWSAWSGARSKEKSIQIPPNKVVYLELTSSVYSPGGIQLGGGSTQAQADSYAVKTLKACCKYVPSKR